MTKRRQGGMMDDRAGLSHFTLLLISIALTIYGLSSIFHSKKGEHENTIQTYESFVDGWEEARNILKKASFSLTVRSGGADSTSAGTTDIPFVANEAPDHFASMVALEPRLTPYVPYTYQIERFPPDSIQNHDMNEYDSTHNYPMLNFQIQADVDGIKSEIDVGAAQVATFEKKHAMTPSPETKCPNHQHGVFRFGKCEIYSRISIVCVQLKYDHQSKKFDLNKIDDKGFGCALETDWNPITYSPIKNVKLASKTAALPTFPSDLDFNDIKFHIRSSDDLFLKMEPITSELGGSFGIDENSEWWLGAFFVVCGILMGISPYYAFKKACCTHDGDRIDRIPYTPVGVGLGDDYVLGGSASRNDDEANDLEMIGGLSRNKLK